MKETIKKNKELIVAIAVVLILIITGSYAWLTLSKTSERVNVIKAGQLSMTLDDKTSGGIKLINAIPQSYQQGILNQQYTFTLRNDSDVATKYDIYLNDQATYTNDAGNEVTIDETNRLGDNHIRFVLLKNGEEATPEKSRLLSQDPGRIIDEGIIQGNGTEITFTLILWIDSKAGDDNTENQVMGKLFNAKLDVVATQVG